MANNTERGASFPWGRDFAPVAAVTLAIVVAVAGSAWVIADAIGNVRAEVMRNAVLIENNAEAIERNAQAIASNAQAIGELNESMARIEGRYGELNESVARLEGQYGELNESMAQLSGQYAEHIREHGGLAAR